MYQQELIAQEKFLRRVLNDLEITQSQKDSLLRSRDNVRSCIFNNIGGRKSMFMAGSFKKDTMIRQHYDLDMFIIWTPGYMTVRELFYEVEKTLSTKWNRIEKKKVGWRIPYTDDFHVDVVPTVQDTRDSGYSYLYNCYKNSKLRTSMEKPIKEIDKYNRREVIKLLKLWKYRRQVPIKSFLLEILTHLACFNVSRKHLSVQLENGLEYIANNIVDSTFYDPANPDNIITVDLTQRERYKIKNKAYNALNREYWGELFQKIRY